MRDCSAQGLPLTPLLPRRCRDTWGARGEGQLWHHLGRHQPGNAGVGAPCSPHHLRAPQCPGLCPSGELPHPTQKTGLSASPTGLEQQGREF